MENSIRSMLCQVGMYHIRELLKVVSQGRPRKIMSEIEDVYCPKLVIPTLFIYLKSDI
jgi:hypothetical protein